MTREDHLKKCKQRALQYHSSGELTNAVISMLSDLSKHAETKNPCSIIEHLGYKYSDEGDAVSVERWIKGFN